MDAANERHWGAWVILRSRVVGFRRQRDLALAVGCQPEQLSRWAQLAEPPRLMRKGFDAALARALQISPQVLFNSWGEIDPADVPTEGHEVAAGDESTLRRKVQAIAELLGPDQLGILHDKGRELLATTTSASG
ncbi:MAG TPA: hypothetical protein VF624_04130 [Tepidisphaeraceae bacterium]|jgi:hypothetical protein